MTDAETARQLVEAALAADGERIDALAAPGATWTTPKGSVYDLREIAGQVAPPEDYAELAVLREGHRYDETAPGRVLVRYETVYRWKDEHALENRVPSAYVVEVRGGAVERVRAFLDVAKAERAAREREAA